MQYAVEYEEAADYWNAFVCFSFFVYFTMPHCSVGKILGIGLHKWQWKITGWQWSDVFVFVLICFNLALAPADWGQSSPSSISSACKAF